MDAQTKLLAKRLWDYHNVEEQLPRSVDFVLATGSHDERVASHAARLMKTDIAPLLVVSGGYGKVTSETSRQTEAQRFQEIAVSEGVPTASIVIEDRAANTGENVVFTHKLLEGMGYNPSSGVLVTKPYMKRRALATALKQWPGIKWYVSGPPLSFEDYPSEEVPERRMIELMVGDLQRIKVYADRGFQVEQDIPEAVWQACKELAALGYDRYVLKE